MVIHPAIYTLPEIATPFFLYTFLDACTFRLLRYSTAFEVNSSILGLCQSKKAPTQKGNKYSHCFQYVINNGTNIQNLFEISNIKCIFAS